MEQKIEIDVINNEINNGTLIISTSNDHIKKSESPTGTLSDIYDNPIKLYNVLEEKGTFKPIEYHNEAKNGVNIFLLEETKYYFSFKSDSEFDEEELFVFIRKNVSEDINYEFIDNLVILNFKGYIGKTIIDIVKNGNTIFEIPIEVRSKKVDYESQYVAMLNDLSEKIATLSFNIKAPLGQSVVEKESQEINYEEFLLIKSFFKDNNLPSIMEYLSRNLYSILESYRETVPTSLAANIGSDELIEMVSNPKDLFESEEFGIFHVDGKSYIPLEIEEMKHHDTIDVPENRFYKYFLELLQSKITSLLESLEKKDKNYKKLDEYYQLRVFNEKISYYLSQKFFKDISKMDYIPLNSQVLQKKEGYRDILKYFLMMDSGFRISWKELTDNILAFQKKMSDLYENWCYFELVKIIEDLTGETIPLENFANKKDDNTWIINLSEGKSSMKSLNYNTPNGKTIKIKLFYNLRFYKNNEKHNYSYSVPLRPDYTILLEFNNKGKKEKRYIHFDAKYKAKIEEDPNNDEVYKKYKNQDIAKMHTYKDAINGTVSAYILYPGDKKNKFSKNSDDSFEGVGAFPLNPGGDFSERDEILNFIKNILENDL